MTELFEEVKAEIQDKKDLGKKLLAKIKAEFDSYINEKMNINPKDIGLYTIFIDDVALSSYKEYEDMVVETKSLK